MLLIIVKYNDHCIRNMNNNAILFFTVSNLLIRRVFNLSKVMCKGFLIKCSYSF